MNVSSHPPPQKSGSNPALVAVLVIVPLVTFLGCIGVCSGVVFYWMGRSQATTWQAAVQQANAALPAPVAIPMANPQVNDWWTLRMLAPTYTAAIDAITSNPQVSERLGEPVEPLSDVEDLYQRKDSGPPQPDGETILFAIQGPRGKAEVSVLAKTPTPDASGGAPGGRWDTYRAVEITVTFSDGSTIKVPAPKEQAGTEVQ